MLKITHSSGFFSCNNIKLRSIVTYFNDKKQLPKKIYCKNQFFDYKEDSSIDITPRFFRTTEDQIRYNHQIEMTSTDMNDQFSDYKKLNIEHLKPFIDKYFSPSSEVMNYIDQLKTKYSVDVSNTCGIFFRGNDKQLETIQPTYSDFINKAKEILSSNPKIKFLVQTDEEEFYLAFHEEFPNNTFSFSEIPRINRDTTTSIQFKLPKSLLLTSTQYYLASVKILSECQQVIHTSGNGELWMTLFRANAIGLHQYLRHKEYIYGNINSSWYPNQSKFWF